MPPSFEFPRNVDDIISTGAVDLERIVAAQAQDPALPDPFLQHIRAALQQFHREIVLMAALRAELMDHILYGFPKIGPELL